MRTKADARSRTGKAKAKAKPKGASKAPVAKAAKRKPAASVKPAPKAARRRDGRGEVHAVARQDVFVQEYLIDLNGRQAAIRAGYSEDSARQTAADLLAKPDVAAAVMNAMVERAKRTGIDQDQVLRRYWDIATADPRDLTEVRRVCCRYCWGTDHHYQWTPQELRDALAEHERLDTDAQAQVREPDEVGGTGYNPKKDPCPQCPECFGDGEERMFAKDSRDLSPQARRLFAGVKPTQYGFEIKTHDQMAALTHVGRHLGMFKEKVELTGKDGGPLAGVVVVPAKRASVAAAAATVDAAADPAEPRQPPPPAPRKPFTIMAAEE